MIDNKEEIKGYECRFAVYCPATENTSSDNHLVKEVIHMIDGTTRPNVRMINNFKRDFYITKKAFQNHEEKKEWEDINKLIKFKSTQSELVRNINKALGTPWAKGDMRRTARNPYIYGTDILSTAVIKKSYQDKYPDLVTPYTVAVYDIETDVLNGTNEIMMGTISFGSKVVTVIRKSFVSGQSDVLNRLNRLLTKYLGEYVEKRKINWEVVLVDTEAQVVVECFKRAHEWKPDFLAIWNIDFDLPRSVNALERAGLRPEDVFSDPAVPKEFRHFTYKRGPKQKVTASGKVTPIKPAAQWHTAFCPSSFYFIDAMCAYKQIRTGSAEEPSYSLDNILNKHLGIRKLKFKEADGLGGIDYHVFMQEKYPLEYVIYNVFDCISMEELDECTNDLKYSLPLLSGCSDFENFKSQPRRLADSLHYFCLDKGYVIGSTSDQMTTDMDSEVIGLEGWIVTLPAHLVCENGLQIIEESPDLKGNLRCFVADLDVSASYPNSGAVYNLSKSTTHKELIAIEGVSETVRRQQGINLSGGITNSYEFCVDMYGLPNMDLLLKSFNSSTI